jgi:hypothetical protein
MINITQSVPQGLQDFYFRAADRMRIEGCVNAIAHEGLNLVLSSNHEALLDHYVALLLNRLREYAPQHRLEIYFPANTESLIARFNEALGDQSVRQAVTLEEAASSARIWIVHDAQKLPDHEMQLLARLIQNFPGANIRAILIMNGPGDRPSLSALGRKVLKWDMEAPSPEQAEIALEQARQDGHFTAVSQLLRRMGKLPLQAQDPAALAPATIAHEESSPKAAPSPGPSLHALILRLPKFLSRLAPLFSRLCGQLHTRSRVIAVGALALVLSVLAVFWMQKTFMPSPPSGKVKSPSVLQPTPHIHVTPPTFGPSRLAQPWRSYKVSSP